MIAKNMTQVWTELGLQKDGNIGRGEVSGNIA